MTVKVSCTACGEAEDLSGQTTDGRIVLTCGACGHEWIRSDKVLCPACGGSDIQSVPLAIVERSRGTQLSILGTRQISLCSSCDAKVLTHYHEHRPSPLMPTDLPTVGEEQMNG